MSQDIFRADLGAPDLWHTPMYGVIVAEMTCEIDQPGVVRLGVTTDDGRITIGQDSDSIEELLARNESVLEDVSFTDVAEGDWYYNFVIPAANAGWFTGNPDGSFGPNDSLTLAQVIVLAARLSSAYENAQIPAAAEGEAWYTPYYTYCLENGIIAEEDGYLERINENATRFEMAAIWDKAAYPPRVSGGVNEVPDGFIPDLAESDEYGEIVYRWYRSGVLTGDAEYRFNGESSITRAEASVILCHLTALVETSKL